jgi:F-type H+-transporting ATPase subunit b
MLNQQWGLIPWTLITFGISIFVLWRYAFGPIQQVIDRRRQTIRESIETAEASREEAVKLLEDYKETLARVRGEADEILERSRRAGEQTKSEITASARAEADRLLKKAHEQVERDTQAALQQLRDEVADLTLMVAEKIAGKSLTGGDHRRLIEQALAEAKLDDLELGARG